MIAFIYKSYIEWVAHTSKIILKGDVDAVSLNHAVISFWHGDSFGVNFLLREVQDRKNSIKIIVTADKRGNYIEKIISHYGAEAIRIPDGAKMRIFLTDLKKEAQNPKISLGIALDGPLGPLHEPKKLGAMLAYEGQKEYILIKVNYTKKIQLTKRWDNYIVPMPYGKMTFYLYNKGKLSQKELKNFKDYQLEIKAQLL